MKPYKNIEETQDYIIREFDENIDPIELMWHRDLENRLIESIEPTDWKIQLEDQLPMNMDKPIFIPVKVWHRTIKGTGKLIIKINKS
jgi:hypothetical protein